MELVNSEIVDAFVKAFEAYRDPGDSFRSCVRHALTEVAPLIIACRIAMVTAWRDTSAADPGIERGIGPRNCALFSHFVCFAFHILAPI
jgi:hypothetical protein